MKKLIKTPIMHRVVQAGRTSYFGGITASEHAGDMYAQTRGALLKLENLLSEVGLARENVASAHVFISEFSRKEEMNRAWLEFFSDDILPARATIGVNELGEGVLVEITAVAEA